MAIVGDLVIGRQGENRVPVSGRYSAPADFRVAMPAGSTYTRTGSATGLTLAGTLTEFAADVPQRTNRGLALEPASTNVLLNNVFDGGGAAPTKWSQPDGSGSSVATASVLIAGASAYIQTATAQRPYLAQTVTVGVGTYTLSFYVEAITGTIIAINMLLPVPGTATAGDTIWPVCPANPSGGLAGVIGVGRLDIQVPVTGAGTLSVWAGVGAGSPATGSATFSLPVAEAGAVATSPILTTGSTATRGLPVFTEAVPAGFTKAMLTYYDGTTTLVSGLLPGGTLDVATAVIGAGKGRFGVSELVTRSWLS
jgi:hypothetical protein